MNLRTVCVITGSLSLPFFPLQQFEESKSEKAKSGVLESSVDEETEVHSGSLIWSGALCHDISFLVRLALLRT